MIWADHQIARLKSLYADGDSCSQIGAAMGFSRNAVIGKIHRLDLPRRGVAKPKPQLSPEEEEAKRLKYRENQSNGQRLRRSAARTGQMKSATDALPEFSGALNIPLVELRDFSSSEPNQCRYIPAEPPGPDYFACAVETLPGESYCTHCIQITQRTNMQISETDLLRRRAHYIRISRASRCPSVPTDLGDAA